MLGKLNLTSKRKAIIKDRTDRRKTRKFADITNAEILIALQIF